MPEQNVQVTQAVKDEMRRISSAMQPSDHDKDDLITYAKEIVRLRHRTRAEPDLVEVPPLIERLEFASANRVCAAPGANGRLCGKCYKCLMRQAAKALRAALTRTASGQEGGGSG